MIVIGMAADVSPQARQEHVVRVHLRQRRLSARLAAPLKFNVTQGKNFDRSGALGPWLVTADEVGPGPLRLTTA